MFDAASFYLHSGLPRQGPGSDASTSKALGLLPPLPPQPFVLDLGCGPGKHTLVLARRLRTRVVAIDIHQPFLDQLAQAARAAGLATAVETRCLSMDALDYAEESVDLIWCEGAVYFLGVGRALRLWRPLLRPGGVVTFTEATWLTPQPPAPAADWWRTVYPAITTVEENLATARREGYQVLDTFALPSQDWWTEYYTPLRARMAALRPQGSAWPELAQAIEETEQEIRLYEEFGDSYGYVFYILRRPGLGLRLVDEAGTPPQGGG